MCQIYLCGLTPGATKVLVAACAFPCGSVPAWLGRAGCAVPAGAAMEELGWQSLAKERFDFALIMPALITKC